MSPGAGRGALRTARVNCSRAFFPSSEMVAGAGKSAPDARAVIKQPSGPPTRMAMALRASARRGLRICFMVDAVIADCGLRRNHEWSPMPDGRFNEHE